MVKSLRAKIDVKTVKMVWFKDGHSEVQHVEIEFHNGKCVLPAEDSDRKIIVKPYIDCTSYDYSEYPPKKIGMNMMEIGEVSGYKHLTVGTVCEVTVENRKEYIHARYLTVVKY